MRRAARGWRGGLRLAALLLLVPAAPAVAAGLAFVHVEANEGMAAGGHAALRVGDDAYHFENADHLLQLEREPWAAFEERARLLQNRTLHVATLAVDAAVVADVRDHLDRRLVAEAQERETAAALTADRRLLAAALASAEGDDADEPVVVPAAGFFLPATAGDAVLEAAERAALASLRDAVGDVAALRAAAERARVDAFAAPAAEPPGPGGAPAPVASRAVAWRDATARWLALGILADATPLRPDALRTGGALALTAGERALVSRLRDVLGARLIALARAGDPGTGETLLLGLGRYAALAATTASGRWQLLDAMPDDAPVVPARRLPDVADVLGRVAVRSDGEVAAARAALLSWDGGAVPEFRMQALEAAGNRRLEVAAALEGADLRLPAGARVPSRGAAVAVPAVLPADVLRPALAEARRREAAYAEALHAVRGYDLLNRSCVTAIFASLDAALAEAAGLAPDDPAAAEVVRARLGGRVDPRNGPALVPAVAMLAVERALPVRTVETLPSRRLAAVEAARERDGLLATWREHAVPTSTLYTAHVEDSAFLFFTDDAVWPRPLFGALNLATAAVASVAGVVTWPFDHGDRAWAGLRGMLFSLPELAFTSLRKGTYLDAGPSTSPVRVVR